MAGKNESLDLPEDDESGFVPAVFVRSMDEAERFRELLDDHDVPAVVATDDEIAESEDGETRSGRLAGMTQGVAVLVPEAMLDEASRVIADFEDAEGFHAAADEFDDDDDDEEDEFGLEEEVVDDNLTASQDEKDEATGEAGDHDSFDSEEF